MQFTPYLEFDGNCAEAFAFYAKLFDGRIVYQGTFGEMPPSEGMPPIAESAKQRIMHVHLQLADQSLMGSDCMPGADVCSGQPARVPPERLPRRALRPGPRSAGRCPAPGHRLN